MSGFGCFGGSLDQSATCETDQDDGHLWVSVWDTSGEPGVSGAPPVSPRSSWMGTGTERPFYW